MEENECKDIKVDISKVFTQDRSIIDDNRKSYHNNQNDNDDNDDDGNQGFFHKLYLKPINKTDKYKEENDNISKSKSNNKSLLNRKKKRCLIYCFSIIN